MTKTNPDLEDDWSAFYFSDGSSKIHVNQYPNISFSYHLYGIKLALNSEVQPSFKFLLKKLKSDENSFKQAFKKLDDFYFSLFYKIQYLPKDHFYWDFIYGYPQKLSEINIRKLEDDILFVKNNWEKIKNTFLYKIINGEIRKADGNY